MGEWCISSVGSRNELLLRPRSQDVENSMLEYQQNSARVEPVSQLNHDAKLQNLGWLADNHNTDVVTLSPQHGFFPHSSYGYLYAKAASPGLALKIRVHYLQPSVHASKALFFHPKEAGHRKPCKRLAWLFGHTQPALGLASNTNLLMEMLSQTHSEIMFYHLTRHI
jgi:hypothetical protein